MPIYEYRCLSCEETFEAYRGLLDRDSKIKCPKCGGTRTKRVLSPFFGKNVNSPSCGPTFSGG